MKRTLSFLAVLLILASLLIVPSQAAQHDSYANQIVTTRNGVVRIFATNPGSRTGSLGSGFAIGTAGEPTTVFATNYHVVEGMSAVYVLLDNDWIDSVPEWGGVNDNVHAVRCEVVYANTRGPDYAILKATRVVTERIALPIMDSHLAYPGDTVFALGYPSVSDEVTDTDPADIDSMTVTRGTISRFTTYEYRDSRVIQIDADINHGNSGGPLVTEQGYVIGLNTWGVGNEDGTVNLALEVDYVTEKLDELISSGELSGFTYTRITQRPDDNAAPTQPQESAAPSQPSESQPLESQPLESQTPDVPETTLPGTNPIEKDNTILFAAIGAGVLAATLVILLLVKKKKPAAPAAVSAQPIQAAPAQPAPAQQSAQYMLTGISGSYSGRSISISKSLCFGRASNCDVIFAEGTGGVSRIHCQLAPGSEGVVLTDLGSSVGTYLANGTKLTPNQGYSLKHGDVFYVGSKAQAFRIDRVGASVVATPAASTVTYSIVCIDGPLTGRRLSLNRDLTFGRNSSNDVVFPEQTPGISGRHCMLSPRDNGVVIMDLGSSYGTFLGNGSKLTPNQKVLIRRGDSFYIGSQKNKFRIE